MAAPNYREAYPRLNLNHAKAALLRDEKVCVFSDEKGRRLGEAFILDTDEASVHLEYCVHGPYFRGGFGPVWLPMEFAPTAVNPERNFFRCPSCGSRVINLFFNGQWSCAVCHELMFRSQVIPHEVAVYERKIERRDELEAQIAKGRPHRMRQTTFAALEAELQAAKIWLKKHRRVVASVDHRRLIEARWVKVRDLADGMFHYGYSIVGDHLCARDDVGVRS